MGTRPLWPLPWGCSPWWPPPPAHLPHPPTPGTLHPCSASTIRQPFPRGVDVHYVHISPSLHYLHARTPQSCPTPPAWAVLRRPQGVCLLDALAGCGDAGAAGAVSHAAVHGAPCHNCHGHGHHQRRPPALPCACGDMRGRGNMMHGSKRVSSGRGQGVEAGGGVGCTTGHQDCLGRPLCCSSCSSRHGFSITSPLSKLDDNNTRACNLPAYTTVLPLVAPPTMLKLYLSLSTSF